MRIMEGEQTSSDDPKDSNNFDKARPKNSKYDLRRNRDSPGQINPDVSSNQSVTDNDLESDKY